MGISGLDPTRRADFSLYAKCQDARGNTNTIDYVINFCLSPQEDNAEPYVTFIDPEEEYIGNLATDVAVSVFVNEPAECKWDLNNKNYELMANSFTCLNDVLLDQTAFGWECYTNLPTSSDVNLFYVRCKDKPWETDDTKRNAMTTSEILTYRKSDALVITSVTPNDETLFFATTPVSVTIEARTSGGLEDTAVCEHTVTTEYLPEFSARLIPNSDHTIHTMTYDQLLAGTHIVQVRCEDSVGNVANAEAEFEIDLDTVAPEVTRVYEESGRLVAITNENAECAYSLNSCTFDFDDDDVRVMSGDELEHRISFDPAKQYNIKCKDVFDNAPSGCSIVVRGGYLD